jgi:hypothetical protein
VIFVLELLMSQTNLNLHRNPHRNHAVVAKTNSFYVLESEMRTIHHAQALS